MKQPKDNDDVIKAIRKGYRDELSKIKEKSEDDYDKNITTIVAGTLAVTLTFHQVIVKADTTSNHWALFSSWISLSFLMIFNLSTNFLSIYHASTSIKELEADVLSEKKMNARINLMTWLNGIKILILGLGVIFFLIYTITNMSSKKPKSEGAKKPIGSRSMTAIPKILDKDQDSTQESTDKEKMRNKLPDNSKTKASGTK